MIRRDTLGANDELMLGGAMEDEPVIDSPREMVSEHINRYVTSDGNDGFLWHGAPTLLLTTRGRVTKALHRTALIFGRRGDDIILVASRGGAPQHPQWFENLRVDARVRVQIKSETMAATARVAEFEERHDLWALMCAIWPMYNEYQRKTEREIPIVVITPDR